MVDILDLVKNLREITGAGFLDCKKALLANDNDIESSIDYLRKKGLLKASKKSSREAKDGAVGIYNNNSKIIILKINSETDFAAKSDKFLQFVDLIGNIALKNNDDIDKDSFLESIYEGKKISEYFTDIISVIGENIVLRDIKVIQLDDNYYNYYVHNSYKKNIGKIISLIIYKSLKQNNVIEEFTKNICMHIAASKPEAIDIEYLDPEIVKKEKDFQRDNIKNSGKPSDIIDKIIDGKMKKFYSESTLLNQNYVLDPDKKVKEVINTLPSEYSFKLIDYKLVVLS